MLCLINALSIGGKKCYASLDGVATDEGQGLGHLELLGNKGSMFFYLGGGACLL